MTSLAVFKGHDASVNAVTFSSDGLFLASASGTSWVRPWQSTMHMCIHDSSPVGTVYRLCPALFLSTERKA